MNLSNTPFKRILLLCLLIHCLLLVVLWEQFYFSKKTLQNAPKATINLGLRTATAGQVEKRKIQPQQVEKKSEEKPEPETETIKKPKPKVEPIKKPKPKSEPIQETEVKPKPKPKVQQNISAQPLQTVQNQGAQGIDGSIDNLIKQHESGQSNQLAGDPNSARYDAQLRQHLMKFKRYPRALKLKRKEAEIEVLFTINAKGELLTTRIVKRTGLPKFEQAVQRLFKRAQPLPTPPANTSWQIREYQLVFTYKLD